MNRDRLLLEHILDCAAVIDDLMQQPNALGERGVRDAVLCNLQVLAESSLRLSPELKARYPQIEWRMLRGFRNVLVHD